jgi:Exostosin family
MPLPWAPGMYASLASSRARAGQAGAFYVAHHHRERRSGFFDDLEEARNSKSDLLWSFMGTVSTHPVRQRLAGLRDPVGLVQDTQQFNDVIRWGWESTHRKEGRKAFCEYATLLGRSSFVLCPRGYGPSSIRLFESLQVGRCPVIISDDWLPPPFVDWTRCSIRVPEARVADLPSILKHREADSEALGQEARHVWEQFFSPETQLATLLRGSLAMSEQISAAGRLALPLLSIADPKILRHLGARARYVARNRRASDR